MENHLHYNQETKKKSVNGTDTVDNIITCEMGLSRLFHTPIIKIRAAAVSTITTTFTMVSIYLIQRGTKTK